MDKSVNQFCLAAQLGILYHRVQDVLALLVVILTVWVEVCNEFQDVCHIDDITVEQFQAEVNVAQSCVRVKMRVWFCRHPRIVFWIIFRFGLTATTCKRIIDVEILATVVHKLLFGHAKVWSILVKLIIDLYLGVLSDDVTELQDETLLVPFALQQVDAARCGELFEEVRG